MWSRWRKPLSGKVQASKSRMNASAGIMARLVVVSAAWLAPAPLPPCSRVRPHRAADGWRPQRGRLEGTLPLEGVQHDALDQVAEGHIVQLSQGFQHLEDPLLEAHPRLHTLHHDPSLGQHDLPRPAQYTLVPKYRSICTRVD